MPTPEENFQNSSYNLANAQEEYNFWQAKYEEMVEARKNGIDIGYDAATEQNISNQYLTARANLGRIQAEYEAALAIYNRAPKTDPYEGLSPAEADRARRIAAGLEPRATTGSTPSRPQLPAEWDYWTDEQKAQYLARQASGATGGRTFEQDVQLTTLSNTLQGQREREQREADARKAASQQAIDIAQLAQPWATSTGEFGGFEQGGPYQAMLNMAGVGQQGYQNRPTPVQVPIPNPTSLASYIGSTQTNINPSDIFNFLVNQSKVGQTPQGYVPPPRFPIGGQ